MLLWCFILLLFFFLFSLPLLWMCLSGCVSVRLCLSVEKRKKGYKNGQLISSSLDHLTPHPHPVSIWVTIITIISISALEAAGLALGNPSSSGAICPCHPSLLSISGKFITLYFTPNLLKWRKVNTHTLILLFLFLFTRALLPCVRVVKLLRWTHTLNKNTH